jgi:DNA-binding phage protein
MIDADTPIDEADRAGEREWTRGQVAASVWGIFDGLRREKGWTQDRLARRLGKNKGQVSRILNNPGNWTLDTVADLFAAMGVRMFDLDVRPLEDVWAPTNRRHDWMPVLTGKVSVLKVGSPTVPTISSNINRPHYEGTARR